MNKAEQIARKNGLRENGHPSDLWVDPRVLKAMDDALEWAAKQCEEVGSEYRGRQHMGPSLGASTCAARIRAGKSQ